MELRGVFIVYIILLLSACNLEEKITPSYEDVFFKYYGDGYNEEGFDLKETPDGGFVIVGYTNSHRYGNDNDVLVVKTDKRGKIESSIHLGGKANDEGKAIEITPDGGFIVVGTYTDTTNLNNSDVYLIKLSSKLDLQWEKTFDYVDSSSVSRKDKGVDVKIKPDGGYLVLGNTLLETGEEIIIFQTDVQGTLSEEISLKGFKRKTDQANEDINDIGSKLLLDRTGNRLGIIVGTTDFIKQDEREGQNLFLLNFNQRLRTDLAIPYPGLSNEIGNAICWSPDNNLMTLATKKANGQSHLLLLKISSDRLNIDSSYIKTYTNIGNVSGASIKPFNNDGYIIVGNQQLTQTNDDIVIMRVARFGTPVTEPKIYGGKFKDKVNEVIITSDGKIALTGRMSIEESGEISKMFLLKVNQRGELLLDENIN